MARRYQTDLRTSEELRDAMGDIDSEVARAWAQRYIGTYVVHKLHSPETAMAFLEKARLSNDGKINEVLFRKVVSDALLTL